MVKLPVVSNVTGYVDEQQVEELEKDALEVSFDDKEGEGELEFFFFDDKELEEEGRGWTKEQTANRKMIRCMRNIFHLM